MTYIFEQLPPELAQRLHPDRRKNEIDYWAMREQLVGQYRDQWIGFAEGRVVASGKSPAIVLRDSEATGLHPFFICVGREDEPCRIRRTRFEYDTSYPGEALPYISAEFRRNSGLQGVILDRVIPDTGADGSVLPWEDCKLLNLSPDQGVQGFMGGVGGGLGGDTRL